MTGSLSMPVVAQRDDFRVRVQGRPCGGRLVEAIAIAGASARLPRKPIDLPPEHGDSVAV
jgi:hypothetical protein